MRRKIRLAFDRKTVSVPMARHILRVLMDPRGWRSVWPWLDFELVDRKSKADLVWCTRTVEDTKLLGPKFYGLNVYAYNGKDTYDTIHLVSDYFERVPAKSEHPDVLSYTSYAINHEFGHFLQARAPKTNDVHIIRGTCSIGHRAAVMTQQTKGVSPCGPNPWPTSIDAAMLEESRFWRAHGL